MRSRDSQNPNINQSGIFVSGVYTLRIAIYSAIYEGICLDMAWPSHFWIWLIKKRCNQNSLNGSFRNDVKNKTAVSYIVGTFPLDFLRGFYTESYGEVGVLLTDMKNYNIYSDEA